MKLGLCKHRMHIMWILLTSGGEHGHCTHHSEGLSKMTQSIYVSILFTGTGVMTFIFKFRLVIVALFDLDKI